jgi:hypothetical protein
VLTIDDFVMLGKTVPEPRSDGRVWVCSAGYSPTLRSLVRIYPLARHAAPPAWSISTVPLVRNHADSRAESFQLTGDRRPGAHDLINGEFRVTGEVSRAGRADLLKRCVLPSIAEADRRIASYGKDKWSLAIIHPEAAELYFEHNQRSPDSPQPALFDLPPGAPIPAGAKRFPYLPKVWFRDADGEHHLSLREWGTFELIRKHNNLVNMSEGERCRYVADALRLGPDSSLLVGNQANARTAWLVIAVLNRLRNPQPSLLDQLEAVAA